MTATSTFETDYHAITQGCGLLDRSERGKLALAGTEAKAFLQGQVSNDVEALAPGQGCYAAFLTPKGKMLGDLRILDAEEELLLDTERSALQELFNMIRRFSIGYTVELRKRTLECGLISLIGPEADRACQAAAGAVPGPAEHEHVATGLGRLIRTDVGIDVLCEAERVEEARRALAAEGATDVGGAAADCLRIERGRPRYGVDLDDSVIPQEAGLNARAVSFTKGCYVGQETVARLYYRGKPNRHLRGLRAESPLPVGAELLYEDRVVGRISSAAFSPRFGAIGLALVRREVPLDGLVTANGEGTSPARVVELPFS
jgi:folate-binding protein YgfZ